MPIIKTSEMLARSHAKQVLDECMVTEPAHLNIYAIAYLRNVLIVEEALEGAQGRLVIRGDRGKARVDSRIPELGKRRFVAAHELGHFELHRNSHLIFKCKAEYFDLWRQQNPILEREANAFASELLMPEAMFLRNVQRWNPSLEGVDTIARAFETSLTATALRILDFTAEHVIVVCSQDAKVLWSRASKPCTYGIVQGTTLSSNTYAQDYFQGDRIALGAHEVLASAWFPGLAVRSGATIIEDSVAMPAYSSVLSLLWIKDVIENVDDDIDPCFTPDGKRYRW